MTAPFVGGAFGGKTMWQHHVLGAAASKLAGRPVRIALSREGVYRVVGGRSLTEQRVAIGADADGRFQALIHTGTVAMTPAQRPARAVHPPGALPLRGRQREARRPGGGAGHARQHLHARAGRGGRQLRPGVRDRRARRADRNRSRRTQDSQRARQGPHLRQGLLLAAPRRGLSHGGRAVRLGQPRSEARRTPRGRMAHRHGLCHRHVSVSPLPRRRCADHADQGRGRRGRDRRARNGHGHRHCPDPGHRRTARPATRVGIRRLRQLVVPRRRPCRRIASDRLDRGRGDRRATRARRRTAEACRRRVAACGSRAGRGRRSRRRALQARRARDGARATRRSSLALSATR